jgi:hypothetical protein
MKKITVRDAFDVDADWYWRELFFSRPFMERMYKEALGARSVEFLSEDGDLAKGVARRLRFTIPSDAPGPVKKLFGESNVMEEDGRYDPATQRWSFRMKPDSMADKVEISGETRIEVKGPGRVERVCELNVAVKIFAIGGLVEQYIASSTEASWAKQTAFTRRYLSQLGK